MEVAVSKDEGKNSKKAAEDKKKSRKNKSSRWSRRFKSSSVDKEVSEGTAGSEQGVTGSEGVSDPPGSPGIIMVKTENLEHYPFEKTQELKASSSRLLSRLLRDY